MGPLLFSIYVNDLPNSVNTCDINMFADDTELHYCHSHLQRVEEVLQNELEQVSNWMTVNRLKLNVDKSLCMLVGTRQRVSGKTLCLSLGDSLLRQVSSTKYLGVCIDSHLTWQNHIDYVLKRVRGKMYSINRLNPPPAVRKLLYQVHILPLFDYCDVVWAPTTVHQTRCLERFHSKYISTCVDSSISRYSLTERRKFHTAIQIFKILHKSAPTYLHNMFNYAVAITGRVNRNAHRLFVPQVNTNYGKRSLHYRGPTIWNALSTALYSATTLIHFRNVYLRTF